MTDWIDGKVKVILELTGVVAIFLGLVFVGLELSQNTAVASAQAIFQLNNSSNGNHILIAQDPVLAELVNKGYEDPESLSDIERRMFVRWMRVRFNLMEASWLYYEKGLVDEGDFAGIRGSICETMSLKGARWFWDNGIGNYADGFVEDVNNWCVQ